MSYLPRHIGFIMDGNGRWAKQKGKSRAEGHSAGIKTVDVVINLALKHKINCISLFVFSTENWARPESEINTLFKYARNYLKKSSAFIKKGICVKVSGSRAKIPKDLIEAINKIQQDTAECKNLVLNLCINYGGKDEIISAVNDILLSGSKQINDEEFKKHLFHPELPDLDLIVRTSGELRLSNFMLFQSAYAELYFTDLLWPDFGEEEFCKMLVSFEKRTRRFGDIESK